ncbi:cryptochrome/photolyase family protein [Roseibium sediminis]|uniref:cryptochrome/photolyase family protein n=1 Tax=Roseibium sediminis TaxID=1775174 RepID=UPI00123CBD75|nr:cryptochrome/photolyase family protein [Roseibium sediminis]
MPVRHLVLVMADQLSTTISSLRNFDPVQDHVLMVEVMEEATHVPHHRKKIVFLLSAMRHFATELGGRGWPISYVSLDDQNNTGSFTGEVARAVEQLSPQTIVLTRPGEWRVLQMAEAWTQLTGCPIEIREDDRFITSPDEFQRWAEGRKQLRMEYFYREIRRKTGLLMEAGKPAGGKWNFDAENRKPASGDLFRPQPARFAPDEMTLEVLQLVKTRFADRFGDLEPFWFAVTQEQATRAFDHFVKEALPLFGDYQDAMLRGERFLYHSVVSAYLNVGLLNPLEMCRRVEEEYLAGRVPINAAEGFIRQVIGWREYVRGIYWMKMPGYVDENHLAAQRHLPSFYWTGETDMMCMAEAISQTREEAYAHHIQRLMVTGNFALLAGLSPKGVHEWYLSVYADAFEWVELPNTLGMSQYADGGILGSKPYAASGAYIDKMSDYCSSCSYDVKQKMGEGACPFNLLYWHFVDGNRGRLNGNPRMQMVYRTWDKMSGDRRGQVIADAEKILEKLDANERV